MSEEKGMVSQEAVTATSADAGSIMPLAADLSRTQDVTTVSEVSTINSTDQFYMNQSGKFVQVDYSKLADAILGKISSKTYSLDQGTKTLIAAINELNSKISNMSFDYFEQTNNNFPKFCYENTEQATYKTFYVSTSVENMLDKFIPGGKAGTALCIRGANIMTMIYLTVSRDLYIGMVSSSNLDSGGIWKSYNGQVYDFN